MVAQAVGKPPVQRPFRRLHPDLPPARNSLYDPWQCGFLHDGRRKTCLFDVRDAQRAMRALGFPQDLWAPLGKPGLDMTSSFAMSPRSMTRCRSMPILQRHGGGLWSLPQSG